MVSTYKYRYLIAFGKAPSTFRMKIDFSGQVFAASASPAREVQPRSGVPQGDPLSPTSALSNFPTAPCEAEL